LHFCTVYFSFAQAGHRGTCLRPLHILALLCFYGSQPLPVLEFPATPPDQQCLSVDLRVAVGSEEIVGWWNRGYW